MFKKTGILMQNQFLFYSVTHNEFIVDAIHFHQIFTYSRIFYIRYNFKNIM